VATSVQAVQLELSKEDESDAANGIFISHKTSLAEFLIKGLELGEQQ